MPRRKITTPLTHGYLPSAITPQQLTDLCAGKVKADLVLLFFKYLLNRSTVNYAKLPGGRRKYIGTGAPDITAWIEIHSDYLEKLFGLHETAKYRHFLVDSGLVEIQNYHNQAGIATRYRIKWECFQHELFDTAPTYRKVAILDKKAFNAERNLYAFRKKQSLEKLAPEYRQLVHVLETLRLDLTGPDAKPIVDTYKLDKPMSDLSEYTYLDFLEAVDGKDIEYYFVDRFGNRFHTVFTMLRKVIRPLLHFADFPTEKLASLDIVNSQPWLSSVISADSIERFVPEAAPLLPFVNELHRSPEYAEYQQLCLAGEIYEEWECVLVDTLGHYWRDLVDEADQAKAERNNKKQEGEHINSPNLTNRDAAKVCFYRVIFGFPKLDDLLHKAFHAKWPNIWQAFASIKSTQLAASTSDKVYANLAFVMQRLESELMLNCIRKFFEHGINHFVTIYDGVLVLERHEQEAKTLMLEVIGEMGFALPQVK